MRPDDAPDRPDSSNHWPRIPTAAATAIATAAAAQEELRVDEYSDDCLSSSGPSSISSTHAVVSTLEDDGDVSISSEDEDDDDHGGALLQPLDLELHLADTSAFVLSIPPAFSSIAYIDSDTFLPYLPETDGSDGNYSHPVSWFASGAEGGIDPSLDLLGIDGLDDSTMSDPLPPPFFDAQTLGGAEILGLPAASPAPPSAAAVSPPVMYQPQTLNPNAVAQQLQALVEAGDDTPDAPPFPFQHPAPFMHPDPGVIGGTNQNLTDFLYTWYRQTRSSSRSALRVPWPSKANEQIAAPISHVQYADLEGDRCDLQGLNWEAMGVTRREARARRCSTYHNYTNMAESDRWHNGDQLLPRTDSFFRFRRMDIKRDMLLMHFQLRNILASTSRAQTFYPINHAVLHFDPLSGRTKTIMRVPYSQVSTMAADHGVLAAGCFNGEYIIRAIDSESDSTGCEVGTITRDASGITNHIQLYQSRSSHAPLAAIASNDRGLRVLDITTQTWLSTVRFPSPVNCTAVSPDRRLRVVVGDDTHVSVMSTDSSGEPEIFYRLKSHRDCAFACDWADDGWTVATGCQDRTVKIWDARKWTDNSGAARPVTTIRTEMSCARSLRFSPVGSGKRVLVAVEEADFVNIIDAQTFESKQTIDVFGEIGGASFTNDGEDLHVMCADFARGGIVQLERCGHGNELEQDYDEENPHMSYDWSSSVFTERTRIQQSESRRRRRPAGLDGLEPF